MFPAASLKKFIQSKILLIALLLGFGSLALFCFSYRGLILSAKEINYQIFHENKALSWELRDEGIFRSAFRQQVDNILYSNDEWQEFESSFFLFNPYHCGFIFNFQDGRNFDAVLFNGLAGTLEVERKVDGQVQTPFREEIRYVPGMHLFLQVTEKQLRVAVNGHQMAEVELVPGGGKLGFIIDRVQSPPTVFSKFFIKGRLSNGREVEAASPAKKVLPGRELLFYYFAFFISLAFLGGLVAFLVGRVLCRPYQAEALGQRDRLKFPFVLLIHLGLTCTLFWPFVSKGWVFVSSYDNYGEIFPLLFLSKHHFFQMLQGKSLGLWNALSHNGMPFFTNHWDMIYYPLNWVVFLFPDQWLLSALTVKTMLEVFLIGLFAYGFFREELQSRNLALFCSVVYQLCSVLLFSLTVFPAVALYFSMTLYLYVLWSLHRRKRVWNFLLLSAAVYSILTSANVAFIFYVGLSLAVITVYRLTGRGRPGFRAADARLAGLSVLTGGLLGSVRILPCLLGILNSNRLVDHYFTIQDRVYMIVRLFLPEIAGHLGTGRFNPLLSDKLGIVFRNMNFPSNAQNVFLVYFGVLSAGLLTAGFLSRANRASFFWKVYAFVSLAVVLLWQPIWGLVSILFFPMNHYSYQTLILPVGVCALVGHTAKGLLSGELGTTRLRKFFVPVLFGVQVFILTFLTYLYPPLTGLARGVFLAAGLFFLCHLLLSRWQPAKARLAAAGGVLALNLFVVTLFLLFTTLVALRPFIKKEAFSLQFLVPSLSLLLILLAGMAGWYAWKTGCKGFLWGMGGLWLLAPLAALLLARSPVFFKILSLDVGVREYVLDILYSHVRLYLIVQIGILAYLFVRNKLAPARPVVALLIGVACLDLLGFNLRFDGLAAPSFNYSGAFYERKFPYQGLDPDLRDRLDLVNYRVSHQHFAGINANKNLIFSLPSYTGIVGYMPKRFSRLIRQFGYPDDTILIYPGDTPQDERFLDLSAVRYRFNGEKSFVERPGSLARLNLFFSYEVIADDDALLARLSDKTFDVKKSLLINKRPEIPIAQDYARAAQELKIIRATSDRILAEVESSQAGLVMFCESYDPGWKAFIDGHQVNIQLADYDFMAIPLPAGEHQVEFIYQPKVYTAMTMVFLAGLGLLILGAVFYIYKAPTGREATGT